MKDGVHQVHQKSWLQFAGIVDIPHETRQVRIYSRSARLTDVQGEKVGNVALISGASPVFQLAGLDSKRTDGSSGGLVEKQAIVEMVRQYPAANRRSGGVRIHLDKIGRNSAHIVIVRGRQPAKPQPRRNQQSRRQVDPFLVHLVARKRLQVE